MQLSFCAAIIDAGHETLAALSGLLDELTGYGNRGTKGHTLLPRDKTRRCGVFPLEGSPQRPFSLGHA